MSYVSPRVWRGHDQAHRRGRGHRLLVCTVVVVVGVAGIWLYLASVGAGRPVGAASVAKHVAITNTKPSKTSASTKSSAAPAAQPTPATQATTPNPSPCQTDDGSKLIVVSISQRRLWACDGVTQAYDSAVVTGMEQIAADLTPTGTYHIYAKQTDLYLDGSDSTGSWHDHVSYWMPFLNNQYGTYGFHDATWRADSDFGNISPDSSNASHGCVELPLATAKWLYDWAPIGTTLTITT